MTAKKPANKKSSGGKLKGRPKPSSPRAGFRTDGSRYDCGGKLKK